ncbi:MAG: CHASE domain-containing protein [Cytophagaceae bacterium]
MNLFLKAGKVDILPYITLCIIFLLSLLGFWRLKIIEENRQHAFFLDRVERAQRAIHTRLNDYNQILLGVKAFFEESDTVTREEWRLYYEKIKVDENYPGIQGIGYSMFISPGNLEQHIRQIRAQGFPEYTVKPHGERAVYTSIVYLEPFTGGNLRAFGFDMFSEPVRRKAMVIARDSGKSTLSGKVKLVQETGDDIQPGFLLYTPVYTSGENPTTVEDRRRLIRGYVYSPFRSYDLFNAIFNYRFPEIRIEIFDGDTLDREFQLYNKPPNYSFLDNHALDKHSSVLPFKKYGHSWTIRYTLEESVSEAGLDLPYIILLGGGVFGLLVFTLMIFQGRIQTAKKTAEKLTKAKQFIIESMPEKVSLMDKFGNVTYINRNWEVYTGLSLIDFRSNWRALIHPDDREYTEGIMKEAFDSGKNFAIEHRIRKYEGSYRWHLVLGTAQKDFKGKIISWLETCTDIHEQKSQVEELKRINSDLDNFVYTASHDLKAPISNMEGLLQTIYEETENQCSGEVNDLFGMISVSIKRLKNTINDLTEISRIQRNYENEAEDIELSILLEEFKQDHKSLIEKHNAKITSDFSVPLVSFSKRNLRSIINNLLSNAIKYSSPDRTPDVHVSTKNDGKYVLIIVSDNGLGLSPSQKARIFDMFKRLHSHVEGSGVGLYIVKRIVDNVGGKIEVESQEGKGTVFKIYLPLRLAKH